MSRAAPADGSAAEVGWLVREGAGVALTTRRRTPQARERLPITGSASAGRDWDTLVEVVRETHGVVHGLVNNAGITHRARLGDVTLDDLNRVLAVNVTGALLGIQARTPLMPPGSSIVNVGSVAALTAHAVATASKWALRNCPAWRAWSSDGSGIRVNSIHPGTSRRR